ncbi:hypothetical protein V8C34DRAFT_292903 [Trichoderma compactum]
MAVRLSIRAFALVWRFSRLVRWCLGLCIPPIGSGHFALLALLVMVLFKTYEHRIVPVCWLIYVTWGVWFVQLTPGMNVVLVCLPLRELVL